MVLKRLTNVYARLALRTQTRIMLGGMTPSRSFTPTKGHSNEREIENELYELRIGTLA